MKTATVPTTLLTIRDAYPASKTRRGWFVVLQKDGEVDMYLVGQGGLPRKGGGKVYQSYQDAVNALEAARDKGWGGVKFTTSVIKHDDCEAFYCSDCKTTFSLSELVERGVEIKNEDGGSELSAYCPDCPADEAFTPRKMSNAAHLEAHILESEV